ncbi:MAG: endolytic transglycosylase MltG [Burkholderiales bacterium]|nr:endolytic transglycosylase MltG [Burkholderiales bacterium]
MLLCAAAASWWANRWIDEPLPLSAPRAEVNVQAGATARAVAQSWVDAGLQTHPRLLYEWFRWSGQARSIRAGTYELTQATTPRRLLTMMVNGEVALERVRFIEGWTFRQLRAELARAPRLRPETRDMSDAQLMAAIGAPGQHPEGRFFPDTYAYGRDVADLVVLKRAYAAMHERLAAAWAERAADSPLKSADEALVLASIVEKETGIESDRPIVAGVFANRLRQGMLLQTDPAVIYGLGQAFDGNLRKRDLLADTPYNTYTRAGLPPTPIALPGLASLRAAVRPQATGALYFVARGDGSSVFSETLAEHSRAVERFQKGGR